MSERIIELKNLVKYFDGRCVLDGIELQIEEGCVYGLLGRNGAGKTTIIRILLGLEPATRGQSYLFARQSGMLKAELKERIGYVAEAHNLIGNYKIARLVKLCKDLSLRWNDEFYGQLVEKFHLPMDRKVRQLSIGMHFPEGEGALYRL